MDQPNDRTVHLDRARRAIRAIVLSLVFAGFGATAALADVCQYSNGQRTLGPCMQFENRAGGSGPYDLYCMQGPTPINVRINMEGGDSFTCKVLEDRSSNVIAKTYYKGIWKEWHFNCQNDQKHIRKLASPARRGDDGHYYTYGRWDSECRTLQPSLRW